MSNENKNDKKDKKIDKKNDKKSFLKSEWSKFLFISVVSLLIAIVGINNNIEREKDKIFKEMKSKIKLEVEKELYKELYDKFQETVRNDLKKECRDFVKIELKKSLRDDTFRALKHQIDNEGIDLSYEIFESIEYKQNGENIHHCEVVVNNLDKVFNEELEGLFKQIFGNEQDKKGVLLVFSEEPEENGYRPDFRIEKGLNDQIMIMKDNKFRDLADNNVIS